MFLFLYLFFGDLELTLVCYDTVCQTFWRIGTYNSQTAYIPSLWWTQLREDNHYEAHVNDHHTYHICDRSDIKLFSFHLIRPSEIANAQGFTHCPSAQVICVEIHQKRWWDLRITVLDVSVVRSCIPLGNSWYATPHSTLEKNSTW